MSSFTGPAILFCPADRPDRYDKALSRADSVIIDLEDAVSQERKVAARENLIEWCRTPKNRSIQVADPIRFVVRVNPANSDFFAGDLESLKSTSVQVIMLPKVEYPEDIDRVTAALPGVSVVALCETAVGIVNSLSIAKHPAVIALMWGAEDLIASIGGTASRLPNGSYRSVSLLARSTVLLNAAAARKASIDSIVTDFSATEVLIDEAHDAAASGFSLKACIHPSQVESIRAAFAPSQEETERARELLSTIQDSRGATSFHGVMVDEPLIRQAENILSRARITE